MLLESCHLYFTPTSYKKIMQIIFKTKQCFYDTENILNQWCFPCMELTAPGLVPLIYQVKLSRYDHIKLKVWRESKYFLSIPMIFFSLSCNAPVSHPPTPYFLPVCPRPHSLWRKVLPGVTPCQKHMSEEDWMRKEERDKQKNKQNFTCFLMFRLLSHFGLSFNQSTSYQGQGELVTMSVSYFKIGKRQHQTQ